MICMFFHVLSFEWQLVVGVGKTWGRPWPRLWDVWTRGRGLRDNEDFGTMWSLGRVGSGSCELGDVWTRWCPERACQQ